MYDSYEQSVIEWAHTYDGYSRIAGGPDHLWTQIEPLKRAYDQHGRVPEWAGVDLLRGWAFYIVRAHRHGGAWDSVFIEFPEMRSILDALRQHPAATSQDLPPASEL
ncbi:hypothetical protein [Mycolicibacterium brumae]|uniref:Uncharacterized protein n=1 Tax=Mycolicibacterium brumae TaxID=85968 RepID=A0A2G5P798_9MYCO|nr:hypothetical protein [Mycolicibacterium brumae]MCV7194037.1 hypothetical protein [Mycolicibacterium brumae]PIB73764.1 hypothetical protein CQY22_015390 [Mycolicibacterium brumae]RWA19951.1 hypothetical protein MBRU_16165 [Mycolicibacterium brumae DSM 44177]UWW09709.1 hypothetical protein L2Z93_002821 [Mycolicibacterium brumae]